MSEQVQTLLVGNDGTLTFLWDDALLPLVSLGEVSIRRASDVEPDRLGCWWSDLGRSGGPLLGPFLRRGGALAAEREWLERNVLMENPCGARRREPAGNT